MSAAPNQILDAALKYLERGWRVIPLQPHGKKPLVEWKEYQQRAPTPKEVTAWFQENPDANLGIVTGMGSGIVVMDVDSPEGLTALRTFTGDQPTPTPISRTARGHQEVYCDPGVPVPNRTRLAPGLDVRGDGGYIVAPPSIHPTGVRYEWQDCSGPVPKLAPAPLPRPLLEAILAPKQKASRDGFEMKALLQGIPEGSRNDTLASLAGKLIHMHTPYKETLMLCREVNEKYCRSRTGDAPDPLPDAEVEGIVNSIWRTHERHERDGHQENGVRLNVAERLVSVASDATFFHSRGEAYAVVSAKGHQETYRVRSEAFGRWLRHRFYVTFGNAASPEALKTAAAQLEARALFDGSEQQVYTRVGASGAAVYLDLASEAWEVVKITEDGWWIEDAGAIRFERHAGMEALPYPEAGGSLEELREFVNVEGDEDWMLLAASLTASVRPTGPYPVLVLQGQQGSAKSTMARVLRALVDPSTAPLRSPPRNEHDMVISANNSWVLSFDNLSIIKPWQADALCRLSTGGGFATRKLYTDTDEILLDVQRPIILNGITDLATRQDLLDRALVIHLPAISEYDRREEREFWQRFEAARPRILGALLDAVCGALGVEQEVELKSRPRMADFARWGVALEQALGWPRGAFMAAYSGNRHNAIEVALDTSPVGQAIRLLMQRAPEWTVTATDLLRELRAQPEVVWDHDSPSTPAALSNELTRLEPALEAIGIQVERRRSTNHNRDRLIRLRVVE